MMTVRPPGVPMEKVFKTVSTDADPVVIQPSWWNDIWGELIKFDVENVLIAAMEHLAWPLVALIIVYLFKEEFKFLLERVKRAGNEKFGVDFYELHQAANNLEINIEPNRQYRLNADFSYFMAGAASELVEISPNAAVVDAWRELEANLLKLLSDNEFDTRSGKRQINAVNIIKALRKKNIIDQSQLNVLNWLRKIRNKAAHSVDGDLTPLQAREYIDVIEQLRGSLNN